MDPFFYQHIDDTSLAFFNQRFTIWSLYHYIHKSSTIPYIDDIVDGCEILHQLIDGKHPIIYRFSTILLVVYRISSSIHSINP